MANAIIGALRVSLGIDSAQFTAGLKQAQTRMKAFGARMQTLGDGIADVGRKMSVASAAVAGAGLAMGALVKRTSDAGVAIRRQAAVANAGATEFQRFAAGARTVGIEQDKLADILKDVNDRVGDFLSTGGGPMADFFENIAPKVGVTADQFKELSGPQALQLYVSSLEKAGLSQQEMTFYLEAMASDATALIPLLQQGGKEMQRFGDEAERAGLVMSDDAIAASVRFSDELRRLMDSLGGLTNRLGVALMPVMTQLIAAMNDKVIPALHVMVGWVERAAEWFGQLSPQVQETAAVIAAALGAGGPVLIAIGLVTKAIGGLIVAAGPLGLVIAAATALAAAGVAIYQNWDGIAEWFGGVMEGVKAAHVAAWEGIKAKIAEVSPEWLKSAWTEIEAGAKFHVDTLTQIFGAAWEGIKALSQMSAGDFVTAWASIPEVFGAILANVRLKFSEMWAGVKALAAQWVDDFLTIGGQIVDGLKAGISAKWDAMNAWFETKVSALTDGVKSMLGIQSPSRVFRAIGQFITEGLGLGIADNAPQVQSALAGVTDAIAAEGARAKGVAADVANGLKQTLTGWIVNGGSLSDGLRSMGQQLLGGWASKLASGAMNDLFGLFGFAKGGAFVNGRVQAFAKGGVVNSPTMFNMHGGTGLMGEAGPEAIMPLARGPGGKLGVVAQGGAQQVVLRVELTDDLNARMVSTAQGVSIETVRAYSRNGGSQADAARWAKDQHRRG